jgi:methanethiol S-methyltransferase
VLRVLAWLGGGAFVGSLALTVWWYVAALDRGGPGGGWTAAVFDAVLVTMFAFHHSVFARDPIKRRLTIVPHTMIRSLYVWIASTLLSAVVLLWRPIGGELYDVTGVLSIAHTAVQLAGLGLIAFSVAGLDPLELAGIRQASHSAAATERTQELREPQDSLQVTGPYGFVRHPLYLGWMLAVFGAAHMTTDRLAFAAFTSFYLIVAVPWEERSLRQSFGDAYAHYTARVRWRIIPYVY